MVSFPTIDRIAAAKRNDLGQLPLTRVLLTGVGPRHSSVERRNVRAV
jgi:hypothetical protein